MQVKSLLIKDFQQFKDFSLDLCYPKGHEFEGQPLKKVCIIGQSGTGKTTLLNFLREVFSFNTFAYNDFFIDGTVNLKIVQLRSSKYNFSEIATIGKNYENFIFKLSELEGYTFNPKTLNGLIFKKNSADLFNELNSIYIPANQNLDFSEVGTKRTPDKSITMIDKAKHYTIENSGLDLFWSLISETIEPYKLGISTKREQFAKLATNTSTTPEQLTEEVKKLKEWEEQQENPLKKLGEEFLDRILNHFNLRVKTEVNFQDIGFIKLETLQGEPVESDIWSTATKQVILTALPLYALKPKSTIVFFDEPERSLYPDIQTKVVDFYTSLAPDSQFFFATHSPMIAAGFEPWEIVELKFNEEGKVYREPYFEGENHIDNYKIDPRYLVYDSILKNVFDIKERTNEKRTEGLMELAMLEKRMDKMNGSNPAEKEKLWEKYEALADKLDWKIK